ncbi:MAG TPA: hypothetical protein VFK54_05160 [Candidatus Limnocylindrales bacterium]|nr:hypothetical protein [Candidatus Limnocylindrales bacterium]
MSPDLLAALALGAVAIAIGVVAIRVGIILGGRLDARLEREEDEPDA